MKIRIVDYDLPDNYDSKQILQEGELIVEIRNEAISNIYIYGKPDNKENFTIPDKAYQHMSNKGALLYVIKGNKLLCKEFLYKYREVCKKFFGGRDIWLVMEVLDEVYKKDEPEYSYAEYDEDNYAEEVRRYELNRMYRDHDEYCDYASNDSEDLDYQYSEDNGYNPY